MLKKIVWFATASLFIVLACYVFITPTVKPVINAGISLKEFKRRGLLYWTSANTPYHCGHEIRGPIRDCIIGDTAYHYAKDGFLVAIKPRQTNEVSRNITNIDIQQSGVRVNIYTTKGSDRTLTTQCFESQPSNVLLTYTCHYRKLVANAPPMWTITYDAQTGRLESRYFGVYPAASTVIDNKGRPKVVIGYLDKAESIKDALRPYQETQYQYIDKNVFYQYQARFIEMNTQALEPVREKELFERGQQTTSNPAVNVAKTTFHIKLRDAFGNPVVIEKIDSIRQKNIPSRPNHVYKFHQVYY